MQPQPQVSSGDWFNSLAPQLQLLIKLSDTLYERELKLESDLSDYSFIVFPLAKAYEGFLKDFLFNLGLISERLYRSHRFRIGRALNPDVRYEQRDDEWVYDNVGQLCGPDFARDVWDAWLVCRNQLFHFFPTETSNLNLSQVSGYQQMLTKIMQQGYHYQKPYMHTSKLLTQTHS